MERWMCLHFPRLALEVIGRGQDGQAPYAVTASHGSRRWILDCDDQATRLGIRAGMGLASAYALAPALRVQPRHPEAEAEALLRLADIAYAYSDRVSPISPDGLYLEIGASLTLFGGLGGLRTAIEGTLAESGHHACHAIAPTPPAARLMTRAGRYECLGRLDPLPDRLASVPVDCCDLPERAIDALRGVGAHDLAGVLKLPRDGLARRWGQSVCDYLDRVLGHRPEPLTPYHPAARFLGTLELPAEVPDSEGLQFAVARLLDELGRFLSLRDAVVPAFRLVLHHAPPETPTRIELGLLEPDRNPRRLLELVRDRLHDRSLPAPVRSLSLVADEWLAHQPRAGDLFERRTTTHDWARLRERLQSRLGDGAIGRYVPRPDHRPERAWRIADRIDDDPLNRPAMERPLWLLEPPRLLTEPTRMISGPERIESGWWDGQDVRRDYYIAEAEDGRRLWIFKDRRPGGDWYVHGLFA